MNKIFSIYYAALVVVVASFSIANVTIPICSLSAAEESNYHFLSKAVIFLFMLPLMIYLVTKNKKDANKYVPFLFLAFFTTAPFFWTTMNRAQKYEREYWSFEGVVEAKYLSSNHQAKSIKVGGVNYESIPSNLWDMIETGDSLIKRSCSETISVNGITKVYSKN
ncbi:MAG: hypothetical protein OQK51_22045 [Kangiellaceae bacterium]|nr:hypothetical protein [Kangiellaceae bacterium]